MKPAVELRRAVLVNVDVQNAFGRQATSPVLRGLRSSEGREVRAVAQLSQAVFEAGGTVVVTKDWHNRPGTRLGPGLVDDRAKDEFAIYGPHAAAHSKDAALNQPLEETISKLERRSGQKRSVVGVDPHDRSRPGAERLIEVHKNTYDVTQRLDLDGEMRPNQAFLGVVKKAKRRGATTLIVTGKIAEVCVRAAVESLRAHFPGMRLVVAEDAVSSMPAAKARALGLQPKEEVMSGFRSKGVEVVQTAALSVLRA